MRDLIERLERATGPDDCWNWPGAKDERGRGRVWVNGRLTLAHRAVWEAKIGPIPAAALLCHHCDNPSCCNPKHLYVGTHKSNVADMFARGRDWQSKDTERVRAIGRAIGLGNTWSRGEGNPKAKLSAKQAAAIRRSRQQTKTLAEKYGVDRTTIQRIRRGDQWTNS